MKARSDVTLLPAAVLALTFSFVVVASAETTPASNAAGTTSDSGMVLDDADEIAPVPVLRLEKELGKDLNPEQETELKKAHVERVKQIAAINREFMGKVSEITGLKPEEILPQGKPRRGPVMRKGAPGKGPRPGLRAAVAESKFIERLDLIMEAKDDNMTGAQKRQVDRAWDERSKAVLAVQEDFARDIAKIANVSFSKIKRFLKLV